MVFSFTSGCVTMEDIRQNQPEIRIQAKQDPTAFRRCVRDILASKFGSQSIEEFSNGLILGTPNTVEILVEQVAGYVYSYNSGTLLMHRNLAKRAVYGCNENTSTGIIDLPSE